MLGGYCEGGAFVLVGELLGVSFVNRIVPLVHICVRKLPEICSSIFAGGWLFMRTSPSSCSEWFYIFSST